MTKSLYGVARTVVVNTRGIEHTFLKGRYLNQELIDKGFAKPV